MRASWYIFIKLLRANSIFFFLMNICITVHVSSVFISFLKMLTRLISLLDIMDFYCSFSLFLNKTLRFLSIRYLSQHKQVNIDLIMYNVQYCAYFEICILYPNVKYVGILMYLKGCTIYVASCIFAHYYKFTVVFIIGGFHKIF